MLFEKNANIIDLFSRLSSNLLLALFLLSTSAWASEESQKAFLLNESAVQSLKKGELHDAEIGLLQATAYVQQHPQIRKNLGSVYYEKGVQALSKPANPWISLSYLQRALDIEPENKQYQRGMARALLDLAKNRADQGRVEEALKLYHKAATYDSGNIAAWLNAADYAWLTQDFESALIFFEKAQFIDPKNKHVITLKNKIDQLGVESSRISLNSEHFILAIPEEQLNRLGRYHVLRDLERFYNEIEYRISLGLPVKLTVVFYPVKDFRKRWQVPDHVIGLFDRKLRLPLPDHIQSLGDMEGIIKHELAHALLHEITSYPLPQWLSEGFAQWIEERELSDELRALLASSEHFHHLPSLTKIDRFMTQKSQWAYMKSFSIVDFFVSRYGVSVIIDFLKSLDEGKSFDEQFYEYFKQDVENLEALWKSRITSDLFETSEV